MNLSRSWIGIALLGTAALSSNATEFAANKMPAAASDYLQARQEIDVSRLDSRTFLQQLIVRNLEVQYSQINTNVTRHLGRAEAGLYEPTFFTSFRKEGRNRQQTIEEVIATNSSTALLNERVNTLESGVRSKLPTGAELSLSYKRSNKSNNVIQQNSFGVYETEYSGLLNIVFKQPLLRNAGRQVTETDKKIAELEHQASLQQLTQQTLKTSIDGLNLYWQLHRAQETVKLRKEAFDTSKALLADAQSRVAAGRTPASALLELRGVVLSREAETLRSLQALHESQSKLSTALNLLRNNEVAAATQPQLRSYDLVADQAQPSVDEVLMLWPPYQIALLRQQQAQIRLNFARNQKMPMLDFVMSYGNTGLGYRTADARDATLGGKYPDWYVGLNFEYPIGGNQKATEQYLAQVARLEQADLELQAIRNAFTNDLRIRRDDMENAYSVIKLSDSEVKLRKNIFDNERLRIELGSGLLSTLIQKQADLIEAQQRLLENQNRYEIALATWQYTRGTLLTDNGIQITSALPTSN